MLLNEILLPVGGVVLGDDCPLERLFDFIVPYDEHGLRPLGEIDLLGLELYGELSEEELRPLRVLGGSEGEKVQERLRESFRDLQKVRELIKDERSRTSSITWKQLDSVLQRYSSTLLSFGRDRDHYGADLMSKAVHSTAFYDKSWKLSKLDSESWTQIEESLSRLSTSIWQAYNGNLSSADENAEHGGLILEKLLRGNELPPIHRSFIDDEDDAIRVHISGSDEDRPAIVPDAFAETGSTNALKEMFPFFRYWSEKAERFVNAEKTVNIELSIGKFFEDLNVTMTDKSDTAELERRFVEMLNRSLEIALGSADFY